MVYRISIMGEALPDYPGHMDGRGMGEPKWKACRAILEEIYNAEDEG